MYPVTIAGDQKGSRLAQYTNSDSGFTPGLILCEEPTQRFKIQPGVGPPQVTFNAHMVAVAQANNVRRYDLPAGGAVELVLTTQLSGCSFAIHKNADNSLTMTHVQPLSGGQGANLQTTLQQDSFWNLVYGRNNYGARRASVFGKRLGGRCRIWAQEQDVNFRVVALKQLV